MQSTCAHDFRRSQRKRDKSSHSTWGVHCPAASAESVVRCRLGSVRQFARALGSRAWSVARSQRMVAIDSKRGADLWFDGQWVFSLMHPPAVELGQRLEFAGLVRAKAKRWRRRARAVFCCPAGADPLSRAVSSKHRFDLWIVPRRNAKKMDKSVGENDDLSSWRNCRSSPLWHRSDH